MSNDVVVIRSGSEKGKLFEHMLEMIEEHLHSNNRENEFIESIRGQWDRRGSVTEKQMDGIAKFYERIDE